MKSKEEIIFEKFTKYYRGRWGNTYHLTFDDISDFKGVDYILWLTDQLSN